MGREAPAQCNQRYLSAATPGCNRQERHTYNLTLNAQSTRRISDMLELRSACTLIGVWHNRSFADVWIAVTDVY